MSCKKLKMTKQNLHKEKELGTQRFGVDGIDGIGGIIGAVDQSTRSVTDV